MVASHSSGLLYASLYVKIMNQKVLPLYLMILLLSLASCNRRQDLSHASLGHRVKYNFNHEWLFVKANPKYANKRDYNDSQWRTVSCPHTFNDEDTFDEFLDKNASDVPSHWCGTVWYRKHFKLPLSAQGQKVYIEFESVQQDASLYINGFFLGETNTGFIPFGYDLTPYIKHGEDNVIAVKVSNERGEYYKEASTDGSEVVHWQTIQGGISSNVSLYTMDPLHITLPLYDNMKTLGVYLYADSIMPNKALVNVEVQVSNFYKSAKRIRLESSIYNSEGIFLAQGEAYRTIGAEEDRVFRYSINLDNPKLWQPNTPYLYAVHHTVSDGAQVLDSYQTLLGLRTYALHDSSYLHINNQTLVSKGWVQRLNSSWAGLGIALPDWLREFTFRMMKEAGANYLRWRHSSLTPSDVKLADKYGFVTQMPSFAGKYEDLAKTREMRINAFRKLLIYYRNNPSVFIWDVGKLKEADEVCQELHALVNKFDPQGDRIIATRKNSVLNPSNATQKIEPNASGQTSTVHKKSTKRVVSPRSFNNALLENPLIPTNSKKNIRRYTSEQFALLQVKYWREKTTKSFSPFFGYNGGFSDGSYSLNCATDVTCPSGTVDAVRLPKESYYALRSSWRQDPQVHIVGHWNYDEGVHKTVYVISNCSQVKLMLNDRVIAVDSMPQNTNIFRFPDVEWEAGHIVAEAYNDGALCCRQEKRTVGKPESIKLKAIVGPQGWQADGSDVVLVDVEVVDQDGQRCPLDMGRIDFSLSGPAIWRGGYNSGKENSTNNMYLDMECGVNRIALRSLPEAGKVNIRAHRNGLKSARVVIESNDFKIKDGLTTHRPQAYKLKDDSSL